MLRYSHEQIVWQEVPGETSLAYTIAGCPVGCKGCHSVDTWPAGSGQPLAQDYFLARLALYQDLISCVLFLGGEWQPNALLSLLRLSKAQGLKTCLYTGLDSVSGELSQAICQELDYLKTGPWVAARGGLENPDTNQKFIHVASGEILNFRFWPTP